MKRPFFSCALIILVIILARVEMASSAAFVLIDSNPTNDQTVKLPDLLDRGFYLKFNNPVDRAYEQYIGIQLLGEGRFSCQWNICGWVEYAENDTKVIWHPSESFINSYFKAGEHFEIDLGISDLGSSYTLKDTQGNSLVVTRIDFSMDACQPSVNVQVSGDPHGICYEGLMSFGYFIPGDTINVTLALTNPTCGQQITLEGKAWVKLPDGSFISLVAPNTIYQMAPGDTLSINAVQYSFNALQYTFSGQEPPGSYEIGVRILDPISGSQYDTKTTGFSFGSCSGVPIF